MLRTRWILTVISLGLLCACSAGRPGNLEIEMSETPRPTLTATIPATSKETSTSTAEPPTQIPSTPTPEPTTVPRQCSLLAGYRLDEFPEIISHPFELPRPGEDDGHHGVDFAHYLYGEKTTIAGAAVQAFLDGRIAASIEDSWPYGNFVIIETPHEQIPPAFLGRFPVPASYSLYHLYAHMADPPEFSLGEPMHCGETIGKVGNTGWSGNYHLHFEVRFGPNGQQFKSMAYYQTTTTEEERLNYEFWRMGAAFILVDPMELLSLFP